MSAALHEATEIDAATARYTNENLADYMIPVNAAFNATGTRVRSLPVRAEKLLQVSS